MSGTLSALPGCRTDPTGYQTKKYPMEDEMLARTVVLRKRRPVEFRSTRSPREVLISLPFRQPSDARVSLARTAAPREIPMQRSR